MQAVFAQHGLTLELFTGLEAFLVALALSEFAIVRFNDEMEYQNWKRMISIDKQLRTNGISLSLGMLPSSKFKLSLIDDFCQRTEIKRNAALQSNADVHIHSALPDAAVEFLHQAKMQGLNIPTKKPEHLTCFSAFRRSEYQNKELLIHKEEFIQKLLNFIDNYYFECNAEVCKYFNLPVEYFMAEQEVAKEEVVTLIRAEESNRISDPIWRVNRQNRLLCEIARYFIINAKETCLNDVKSVPKSARDLSRVSINSIAR